MIHYTNITDTDSKPTGFNADVEPSKSIRIFGTVKTGSEAVGETVWLITGFECDRVAFVAWRDTLTSGQQAEFVACVEAKMPAAIMQDWLEERSGNRQWVGSDTNRCELVIRPRYEPVFTDFDLTFRVGDTAVYGSYNLTYTGRITSIGPKTVTVQHYEGSREVTRLSLVKFISRNWNFDRARIERENAIESQAL